MSLVKMAGNRWFVLVFTFFIGSVQVGGLSAQSPGILPDNMRQIFLLRHAERADDSPDSKLSDMGLDRAQKLSAMLELSGIEKILSTDYQRTSQTVKPLLEILRLEVEYYDPRKLEELADVLLAETGKVLVVGHSNTTPQLVELLGGESYGPIGEDEFDRLYVLTIITGNVPASSPEVDTLLLHY